MPFSVKITLLWLGAASSSKQIAMVLLVIAILCLLIKKTLV